jgi:hypothetical protein
MSARFSKTVPNAASVTPVVRLGLTTLLAGAATAAGAVGFVNNRAEWLALTAEARAGYVQGLNDSLNYTFVDDTLVNALAKRGRTQCLVQRKISAAQLADLITAGYRNDQYVGLAPSAVYILRITELCRDEINRVRQEYGLGPL